MELRVSSSLVLVAVLTTPACSSSDTEGTGAGGAPPVGAGGEASVGGSVGEPGAGGQLASGGSDGGSNSSGGAFVGGASSGGASSGGAPGGGGESAAGGTSVGGTSSGGAMSGGSDSGGSSSGGSGSGGESGYEACPADATFCADFESSELPTGAIYNRNGAPAEFTMDFVIDNTTFFNGAGALRVKTTGEEASSAYKMLAVPAPGPVFWVRTYIRANEVLGQGTLSSSEHNRFLIAANGDSPNTDAALEVAEDCGIALNSHDAVYRPEGGNSTCDAPLSLPADEWYCLQASFDGNTGSTQVYVDGVLQIDAQDWAPGQGAFTHLKFGVDNLHPIERQVWYDDVAVGPTRPLCK